MEAVFLKLLNMSLTASLLILAVLPVRLLMKKAPKWITCLLWLMVAVALLCPVRIESRTSVLPIEDPITVETIMDTTVQTVTEPPQTGTAPSETVPAQTESITTENATPLTPLQIGSIVWVIGMMLLLAYALISWLRLRRRVTVSMEVEERALICDRIDRPFILGIIRPSIYLPSALEPELWPQVLLHERAHLARKDHWWKPMGFLLLTLHWFNPLVWAAYILLCCDIELACDEKVIKNMAFSEKKRYSEVLLSCSVPRHMIAACPLAFGEVGVKQRISAVLHYKKPAFWVIIIAVVVCIALCFAFLTEPEVATLQELGEQRNLTGDRVGINYVVLSDSAEDPLTTEDDISALCDLLASLEVHPTKLTEQPIDHVIALCSDPLDYTWFLNFNEDYSYLWISMDTHLYNIAFAPGEQSMWLTEGYEVLNAEKLLNAKLPYSLPSNQNAEAGTDIQAEQKIPVYIDMDVSFKGHESLYHGIKNEMELNVSEWTNIQLVAAKSYNGYQYAVIRHNEGREEIYALLEYTLHDDGTAELLTYAPGHQPNESGLKRGFEMNCMYGTESILYWSLLSDTCWATTADGKEIDTSNSTAEVNFTGFRFTMRDLSTYDFPVEGEFFLAEFNSVQPPIICTPIAGKTLLAALGWEISSGSQSIHLNTD